MIRSIRRLFRRAIFLLGFARQRTRTASGCTYDAIDAGSDVGYLLIHGGGWTGGSRNDPHMGGGDACERLARHYDCTIVNTDYPLATATENHWATQLHALSDLLDHLSDKYLVDEWVIVGASAGAHLGAELALLRREDVREFIGFYGCYDLTAERDFMPEVNRRIEMTFGDLAREASPMFSAWPGGVGVRLIHGDEDQTVNIRQSERMAEAVGVPLIRAAEGRHAFDCVEWLVRH